MKKVCKFFWFESEKYERVKDESREGVKERLNREFIWNLNI